MPLPAAAKLPAAPKDAPELVQLLATQLEKSMELKMNDKLLKDQQGFQDVIGSFTMSLLRGAMKEAAGDQAVLSKLQHFECTTSTSACSTPSCVIAAGTPQLTSTRRPCLR